MAGACAAHLQRAGGRCAHPCARGGLTSPDRFSCEGIPHVVCSKKRVEDYAMLNTIKGFAKADEAGIVKIQLDVGLANIEIEYVLVWQPVAVDNNGWPVGFIERTYGSMADDPMD